MMFRDCGMSDYYSAKLQPLKSIQGTIVTGKDIEKYTSKKDILYLLHLVVADQTVEPRSITAKQLFFLLIFYLK
jgi:hypothetical protein